MESFEKQFSKKEINNKESVEDNFFEDESIDRFLTLLEKEPKAEDIVKEIKTRFNEMETVTKRAFDDSLESVSSHERLRMVDLFARRSALDYISLHKTLVEMLDFASYLSEEEKETIIEESQKTAKFFEGHTLLSFYANRKGLEKKKSIDSLKRNTENAALQQFMAQYYLRHFDNLENIEGKLDSYGRRAFGSEEDYESFKRGVVSLADAYSHIESMGKKAYFPPPRMDAENEIDLISIDPDTNEEKKEEIEEFFYKDFSLNDLVEFGSNLESSVYGIQVKTRHKLKDTYKEVDDSGLKLNDLLKDLPFDGEDFEGLDSKVVEDTEIHLNNTESVTGKNSSAIIFSCEPVSERSFTFGGVSEEDVLNKKNIDKNTKKIASDIQEISTFMGRKKDLGTMYVFVEQEDDQN